MTLTEHELRAMSLEALRSFPPEYQGSLVLGTTNVVGAQARDIFGEQVPLRTLVHAAQWAVEHKDGPTTTEQLATALAEVERLTAELAAASTCAHRMGCPAHPDRTLIHDPDERG